MNGSGCKNCPVNHCETMNYRGSTRAAQRAKFGLGDTKTNADRIRAMSDEELSVFLWEFDKEEIARATEYALERRKIMEWLKQPAEE